MSRFPSHHQIPKNDDDFELLCLKLLRKKWKRPQLNQYGKRGERQDGIDLLDVGGTEPLYAAQCKKHEPHKTIQPSEIQAEVDKAKAFRPKIGIYAILTSAKPSTAAHRKITQINREHAEHGLFNVEFFDWRGIEQLLDEYAEVRSQIYGGMDSGQADTIIRKVDELRLTIRAAPADGTPDTYHADIDEAKAAIESRNPHLAKLLLNKLRTRHWDELTPRLRFRVISNLGAAFLLENDNEQAAKHYLEAKTYQPHDERARTNEILAHFLLGNLETAFQLASRARNDFPYSPQVAALWISSAPRDVALTNLESETETTLRSDAEVAVATAVRALAEGNLVHAEEVLRQIRTGSTEWSSIPALLGRIILGDELKNRAGRPRRSTTERLARLTEAARLITRAIESTKKEGREELVPQLLLDRASILQLCGDEQNSAADVESAYRLAPLDPQVVTMMGALSRSRGHLDWAIELLNRAVQAKPHPETRYHLASALNGRNKPGDLREAANQLCHILREPQQLPKELRQPVVSMAVSCLIGDSRVAEAEDLLNSLGPSYISNLSINTFQAQIALKQGQNDLANTRADAGLAAVTPDASDAETDLLARLLIDLGRHKEAMPLLERVTRPDGIVTDPRLLLATASRLQRHDVILRTCDSFRKAGKYNRDLLNFEVHVLEQYDTEAAIATLQKHLDTAPGDKLARLQLSLIAFKTGRKDLVSEHPDQMPDINVVTPEIGFAVVQVLKLSGNPDAALGYAYELLRRHFKQPSAHRAYQFVLAPLGPVPVIPALDVAGPGAAVSFVEEGQTVPRTVVIEETPESGPPFAQQLDPSDLLARAVRGKRVGETFVLHKGVVSTRRARITAVINKYVYRYQDSLSEWQIRFPEDATIESIQTVKEPGGEPDLSELLASIDRRQEAVRSLEEIYRTKPTTIHMIASMLGNNAFEGINNIARRDGLSVACCVGTADENKRALDSISTCSEIVLDLTAIGTLSLIGHEGLLKTLGIPIIVSQSTFAELTEMVNKQELETSPGGLFTKIGEKYALLERTRQDYEQQLAKLKSLASLIKSCAEILPCMGQLVSLPPDRRDLLYKALGQHGAESILLATMPGRVLWTDDYALSTLATLEHGAHRIWTQVLLEQRAASGTIPIATYIDASAKLMGFDYFFTKPSEAVLIRAAQLAEWQPDSWPLKRALEFFKLATIDVQTLFTLLTTFMLQIYVEPIDPCARDRVFIRILDNFYVRAGTKDPIQGLQHALQGLFGLNGIGRQQASDCIRRWLSGPAIAIPA